jgi:ABC-type transport system substrate-binding protein
MLRLIALALALGLASTGLLPAPAAAESLTVLLPAEFPSLDPREVTSGDQYMVMYHVYCRLYTFADDMTPLPDLVVDEKISADQKTWTLKIRRGYKFHDGTPVNAEAVKYTVERMKTKGASGKVLMQAISEVRTEGEDTVVLRTEKPYPSLRANLAHSNSGLVSPAADKQLGDGYGVQPVSCGPYRFKEWARGNRIVVTRHDDFPGPKATFDQITFQIVPDVATRLFMMQRGEADMALRLGPMEARQLEGSKVKTHRVDGRNIFYQLNYTRPPTNDLRVRQAINHAVDKQAIIQKVLQSAGSPARSVLEAMVWGHAPIGTWAYDPDKARQLLKAANAVGAKIVLMSPDGRYPFDSQVSQAVAGYLKAVGFDVDLKVIGDWPGYIDAVKKREFNLYMLGWAASTGDPDQVMQSLFHSRRAGQTWNLGAHGNKEADALIDQGAAILDPAKRKAIYLDLQKRLFADAPWLFMYRATSFTAYNDKRIKEFHTLEGPEFHFMFPLPR